MTAKVIPLKMPVAAKFECSKCGTEAACNCGAPVVPLGTRLAEAIAKKDGKSNRTIAAEQGCSEGAVRKARGSAAYEYAPDDRRIGRDGKSYPAKPTRVIEPEADDEDPDIEEDIDPRHYRTAYLLRVDQAIRFAAYSGKVSKELVAAARRVAKAWDELARDMEKEL